MGYTLLVAEKPSAAKKLAEALADGKPKIHKQGRVFHFELTRKGEHIFVVPAVGHLYGLIEANKKGWNYPVFETKWVPIYEANKRAEFSKKYLDNMRKVASGADKFVSATDYDVEGSVIAYNILRFAAGTEKAKRMKFSTLTKKELCEAFDNAMPELDFPQIEAGLTRHQLDWIYGINLTRALTLSIKKAGRWAILSTGRVQGPALAILYKRETEIKAFKPVPFWQLELHTHKGKQKILALHIEDKFWEKEKADTALKNAKGGKAKVDKIEKRLYKQAVPTPFNLTSLQTEAYRHFGYTPRITQQIAQSLYEKAIISYPRTSSQQLPPALGLRDIIQKLYKQPNYTELAGKLLEQKELTPNNGKKTDPAHPAIHPTGEKLKLLTDRQKKLYDLIVRRFLSVFAEPAERESMKITFDVNGEKFAASGRRTVSKGWMIFYGPYAKFDELTLPKLSEGETLPIDNILMLDKETQPPSRYNMASLIKILEKENVGTKATRADIIQTLYSRGYVREKSIEVSELGIAVVQALEKHAPQIVSIELTRDFETKMEKVSEGKTKKEEIIEDAKAMLTKTLTKFKKEEEQVGKELLSALQITQDKQATLGKCPACKDGMVKRLFNPRTRKQFAGCSTYPKCKNGFPLPLGALIAATGKTCDKCNTPIIRVIRAGRRPFTMCLDPKCPTKADWGKKKRKAKPSNEVPLKDVKG